MHVCYPATLDPSRRNCGITTYAQPVRLRFNELQRKYSLFQFISDLYRDLHDYVTVMRSASLAPLGGDGILEYPSAFAPP